MKSETCGASASLDHRPASRFAIWLAATRPRTLPAAVAPVLAAAALAWRDEAFELFPALACLAFALLIQIGTNFANDYYDFIKGADTADRVGPRRAVASGWVAPQTMKRVMIGVFLAAFLVGLTLLTSGGWPLLIIGLASIACGFAYTGGPYPLGYNGLGDLFVFIFFGLVAVGATYYVQAEVMSGDALLLGAGIGALAANILVVNNYRDVATDAVAGKRTLVVRWGKAYARGQFAAAHGLAVLILFALGWDDWHPLLLGLSVVVCAGCGWLQSHRLAQATTPAELIALLGQTGVYLAGYAMLVSAGLVWA